MIGLAVFEHHFIYARVKNAALNIIYIIAADMTHYKSFRCNNWIHYRNVTGIQLRGKALCFGLRGEISCVSISYDRIVFGELFR